MRGVVFEGAAKMVRSLAEKLEEDCAPCMQIKMPLMR